MRLSQFSVEWGDSVCYRLLISVAPTEPPRSLAVVPLAQGQRYYGEAPARPVGGSGAGLKESV
jgi:hypothetical protein